MLLQKNIKLNKLVKTNSSVFSTRTCTVYNVLIIKPVKPGGAGGYYHHVWYIRLLWLLWYDIGELGTHTGGGKKLKAQTEQKYSIFIYWSLYGQKVRWNSVSKYQIFITV